MTSSIVFQTAGDIIRRANVDAGLLQQGDDLSGDSYADGLVRLNDLINLWQTQGLKVFLAQDLSIPLQSGKGAYSIGLSGDVVMDKPLQVLQGYFMDLNGIRRPLIVLSWEEWTRLSQVNQSGQINSFFVDKQASQFVVHFWLIPDSVASTGTAHLVVRTQVTNFTAITDQTMFPPEWTLALRWGLADDLATGQPQAIMDRCEKKANMYRNALEDWDTEDSPTTFSPDQRAMYGTNSFR